MFALSLASETVKLRFFPETVILTTTPFVATDKRLVAVRVFSSYVAEVVYFLTYGMLNTLDMNRNSEGIMLTRGIFSEFYCNVFA